MTKPHGSNPRARRLARNGEAILAREAKQSERRRNARLTIAELRTMTADRGIPSAQDWTRSDYLDALERQVPPKPASEESP